MLAREKLPGSIKLSKIVTIWLAGGLNYPNM
jgi:hypothetical protein